MTAARIAGVSLTSADADELAEFYIALGFERAGIELRGGPAFAHLAQQPRAEARVVLLRLGEEWLELVTFAERGRPYPANAASSDPWFQHFAIVVSSMQEAFARLVQIQGWTPITQSAPQRLPESSGGVTAFKFRDPEGHPLELLEFPAEGVPSFWHARDVSRSEAQRRSRRQSERSGPFLGIDHSAIVVAGTERSVEFYARRLGFTRTGASRNRGLEQARLDGLSEPDVEVTALALAALQPPHLELLCYRTAAREVSAPPTLESRDVAAARLLIEIADPARIQIALGSDELSPVTQLCGALIHDPDGHALLLVPRG